MPKIKGVVEEVTLKEGFAKATGKPYTIYMYSVDGQIINGGFDSKYIVGDQFDEECTTNKFGQLEISKSPGRGKFVASRSSIPGPTNATPPPTNVGRKFPVDKQSPETSIIRQSALKAAVDVYNHQVIKGVGDTSVQAADPDELAEAIIRMAYKFADFSSGQREAKIVKGE